MQNSYHQLATILIATFTLLQIVVLFLFGYTPYPDSNGYILLAKECIAENDIYPIASKLNDYPFLWNIGAINAVLLSLKIFNSVVPLLVVYAFMKGATALFFYEITKSISNEKTAFVALILYIIYPANYGEATSTLSELPFMFFTMLGLYLCLNKKYFILGGMSLAFANWFRPMGIVFLLAVLIYLFVVKQKNLRPLVGYVVMIVFIGSLSYMRTGLFLYQAKTGWMALADYSTRHSAESMKVREHNEWNVSQKDSAWQSLFRDWLKDHPTEYIQQMPTKLINTYVSDNVNMCTFIPNKKEKEYMYEEVSMQTLMNDYPAFSAVQWLTVLNLLFYYLILITATCSLFYFNKENSLLPILIISLGTILLLFAGHGEARFHIPFIPYIIMLSALYLTNRK
jgi:4-amino-4-deoxy-L-arabinose transferase-like glycosyltransferase